MFHKSRQCREIVALVVFHDYQRALAHKARREYGAGNLGKAFHIIWRVGKHDVESLRRRRYIAQGVAANQRQVVSAKLFGNLLNEALLCRRLLYSRGRAAARLRNSNVTAPVPANRSRVSAPSMSAMFSMTLNMFSRAKSVVGLADMFEGTSKRRRPYFPLIIRIVV